MVKGVETPNRMDIGELEGGHIRKMRSNSDLENDHANNLFSQEATRARTDLLERMNREGGVISENERESWQKKIVDAQEDMSRLRSLGDELNEHLKSSKEVGSQFDQTVHAAEDSGILRRGEHDALDEKFMQSDLADKERALREIEKELEGRRKELNRFFKLEKNVQEKRRKSLDSAEDYDTKLKVLETAEHENENLKNYAKLWKGAKGISNKTINEYLEWFLTLSDNEQTRAVSKVEKEDITPRVQAWEIHKKLPSQYQDNGFESWGLTRRLQYLGHVERRLDREYRSKLREGKGVFADKSIAVFEREFDKMEQDLGKRLQRKINFSTMLGKQLDMEKKLWKEFEKFPEEVRDMLEEEFNGADFEDRRTLLSGKAPKIASAYTQLLNRLNNKIDPHISEIMRDAFEGAKTIEAKTKVVQEAEAFQKSKNNYFKKWDQSKEVFRSNIAVYEKWYAESVHSSTGAKKAESDLDGMIKARKKVHDDFSKLPEHLRARANEETSFANRENQLQKLQEIARYYQTVIPFLLKNAEKAEAEEDIDTALNFYLQALKLDPHNRELQVLAAHLRQKGANPSLEGSSSADDDLTEQLLEQVDGMEKISNEAEQLARKAILLSLSKKHRSFVGATGTTATARAKSSIKNLGDEDLENAQNLLEDHDDSHTVDETGIVRKKVKVKSQGEQVKETADSLNALFEQKVHRGSAAQSGLSEVEFVGQDGRAMEHGAVDGNLKRETEHLATDRRKNFLILAGKSGLSEKQLQAVQSAYDRTHEDDELLEDGLERLAA